ncbi:hypothetical protein M9458_039801, partial [Cirrhinus mrigala]
MPCCFCRSCKASLHAADGHGECVSCLGKSHTEATLNETECPHCEDMSLASLRSRIAFFSERDSAPCALPSRRPNPVEDSPVLFARPDLDLVSFGGSEDDMLDSMSLAASDAEELSGSVNDPAPLSSADTSGPRTGTGMDAKLFRVLTRTVDELGLEWSPPEEPSRSLLDEWFLPGRHQAPRQRASPFFPEVHEELTKSWHAPYSARLRPSSSSALTSVDGAEDKGYEKLPPLDESVAAHLCPPTAIGWKAKASHPSKPCRTTSAPAGRAYASAGQAASALHSMVVLQVFQAKLLAETDKSALDTATLTELRSATDLALHATKATTQAIGRSMASLVVLERHLWLTLTELKDVDKVPFLDAPVSPTGLFGPAVEGFAERFSAAQKTSQAMRHFLPKRSSSAAASGRPKSAPPQQPVKPAPAAATAASAQPAKPEPRQRSRSARRYPFPKRQGPRPKLVLDPAPPPSGGGKVSRPLLCLQAPRMVLGAEVEVFCVKPVVNTGPVQLAPTQSVAVIANKIKRKHFQKESKFPLSPVKGVSPRHDGQPLKPILPLATRAEAWQAIPGVSEWVLGIIKRGYSLQFARRPPRFSGMVPTLVVSKDAHVLRSEVMNFLEKGTVEVVHPAQSESGFYSRYFLVPKKDGGLRPILNLRLLNRALMKRPFKMITLKQILSHIRPGDWFFSLDLKDAYFHIQIAPHHRRFLRFAFEGVAYQYTVLSFGLSLAPRTFTKCMDVALSPPRQRGIRILNYLKVNLAKSALHPSRRISFLGAVFRLDPDEGNSRARSSSGNTAARGLIQNRSLSPPQNVSKDARPYGLSIPSAKVRPASYAAPSVLAETTGSISCVVVDQTCVEALIPWKNSQWMERGVPLGMVCRRKVVTTDASNTVWGALCDGKPAFGLWTKAETGININCLEMLAVHLKGHHVLVHSDSMTVVSYINRQGGLSSKRLFTLVKDLLEATHVPGRLNQGADMLSRSNVPSGESLARRRQLSLPSILFEEQGRVGPRLAQPPPLCFSPDILDCSKTQASFGGPSLEKPALVLRAVPAARSSPLAHSPETRPPLSSERDNMAPPAQAVGPAPLVSGRESMNLSESFRLQDASTLLSGLSFPPGAQPAAKTQPPVTYQDTPLVYVAAITASHAPIAGQSVGRNNLVVRFLKGSRRLNPPRPHTIPTWDLSTVLRALKGPPFEPLPSSDLRPLTFKAALLLALASVKRMGDLQALSVSPSCLEFRPGDSKVILKPRHGYVPKVPSTPFRAQVITLSALPSSEEDQELNLLCPVRALRTYIERSASFRQSEQLFVCFGGRNKGHPVTKQRLSRWIVDAIRLAYSSLGLQCPIGVCAHSTRGMASSWAWSFTRFYNLDLPALQARVLLHNGPRPVH